VHRTGGDHGSPDVSTQNRATPAPGTEPPSLWDRIGRAEKLASLVAAVVTLTGVVIGVTVAGDGDAPDRSGGDPAVRSTRVDPVPPRTATTAALPSRTTESATSVTSAAGPVGSAVLYSGTETAIYRTDDFDLDDVGYGDLEVTEASIDGVGRTQISGVLRTDADPTHARCAALLDAEWRTSAPLSEFKKGATYCVRLGDGHHAFLVVRSVRLDGGGLLSMSARWTTWE
jgi:hypothetical protein